MFPTSHPKGHDCVGEFGDKFRKAREKKELSLDDVSNVTKISSRMLQAIEEEKFDQLPGGVFNKGFIRAYAKHLGLDSEDAVTDYLACLRQAQIDSHAGWDSEKRTDAVAAKSAVSAPAKPAVKVQGPVQVEELPDLQLPRAEHVRPPRRDYGAGSSSGIPWRLVAVAAVILIASVFLWNRRSRSVGTVAAQANTPTTTVPAAPAQTRSAPPPSKPAAAASTAPRPSTPTTQPSQSAQPVTTAHAATSAPATPASIEEKSDVTIRSFGQPLTKPSEKPAASLSLVIRATENSWISVSSDGQLVTQETLIAPAHTSAHASREIIARIGNAAGVTFLWNGKEIPAQGAEGEAKTFTFDSQGMHETSTSQNP